MTRITLGLTIVAALTLAPLTLAGEKSSEEEAELPKIGELAPAFELTDLEGETHRLEDFRGEIVVLHFQSCRCPWDVAYQPMLNELAAKFGPIEKDGETIERVHFLAVNANRNEDSELIDEYATDEDGGIGYPVLKDEGNKVADLYRAMTTPHIFIIDAEGVLRYKGGVEKAPRRVSKVGKSEEQYLEPALEALLAGSEPPFTETIEKGCSIKREKKDKSTT